MYNVLSLKTARRDSISNLTFWGFSLSCRQCHVNGA